VKKFSMNFPKTSQITRQSEMERKFNLIRLNKYNEKWDHYQNIKILAIFLGSIFGILIFKNRDIFFNKTNTINYCDSEDFRSSDCVRCPYDAICKNGKIKSCYDNKIIYNQQCIIDDKYEKIKSNMLNYLDNYLKYKHGSAVISGD